MQALCGSPAFSVKATFVISSCSDCPWSWPPGVSRLFHTSLHLKAEGRMRHGGFCQKGFADREIKKIQSSLSLSEGKPEFRLQRCYTPQQYDLQMSLALWEYLLKQKISETKTRKMQIMVSCVTSDCSFERSLTRSWWTFRVHRLLSPTFTWKTTQYWSRTSIILSWIWRPPSLSAGPFSTILDTKIPSCEVPSLSSCWTDCCYFPHKQ